MLQVNPRLQCELEKVLKWRERKPSKAVFPLLLTGCLSQQSFVSGRIFLCTTTSCRSSRDGCWPTSSSNGSMYSQFVPNEVKKIAESHTEVLTGLNNQR